MPRHIRLSSRPRRNACAAAIALSLAVASVARAQQAYFSLQGTFSSAADVQHFGLSLPVPVSSGSTLYFATNSHSGGTSAAGYYVSPGGFDPILTLYDASAINRGRNDDGHPVPDRDSFLSWPPNPYGGTFTLDPLPAGNYQLDLTAYTSTYGERTPNWQVDLVGSPSQLRLASLSATGSSVTALNFGTTAPSATPALLSVATGEHFNVDGVMGIGYSGDGLLTAAGSNTWVINRVAYLGFGSGAHGTVALSNGGMWLPDTTYIGLSGSGTMTVASGSSATIYGDAYLAYFPSGSGAVTVTGSNSHFTVLGDLEVGDGGVGTLRVESGGHADSTSVGSNARDVIGDDPGGNGAVTVTGPTSRWDADTLYIANRGTGSLSVESGGQLASYTTCIAYYPGSTASATVTGTSGATHSSWQLFGPLYVGGNDMGAGGTATLVVSSGALLSTLQPSFVYGHGTVNIANPGTLWQGTVITIGGGGAGTAQVNLTDQAVVNSEDVAVATNAGGGTLAIDGFTGIGVTPATWNATGNMIVGSAGLGSGLAVVQNQGHLNVSNELLIMGSMDATGTLTVRSGGHVTATNLLHIDDYGTVNLSDPASRITTGHLTATPGGVFNWNGGTLEVTSNGLWVDTAATDNPFHGTLTLDTGEKLIVSVPYTGATGTEFAVGCRGTGSMTVQGGAVVESRAAFIGSFYGSNGSVIVQGNQTSWTSSTLLRVAEWETSVGSLTVRSSATLNTPSLDVGYLENAHGTLNVEGSGTTVNSGALSIGYADNAVGSVNVRGGAHLNSSDVWMATWASGSATALVEDANSQWNLTGSLDLGNAPTGSGKVTVRTGGQLNVGGAVTVHPHGTVELLGSSITAHSFIVESGGTFTHSNGTLTVDGGTFSPGVASFIIDGPTNAELPTVKLINGATASLSGTQLIGYLHRGSLQILSGSWFDVPTSAGYPSIGHVAGSDGELIVDGPNSRFTTILGLVVGASGTGALRVRNGGLVYDPSSPNEPIGVWPGSHGTVEVTGTAPGTGTPSTYTTHGPLEIGRQGVGLLTVSAGGRMNALAGAEIALYPSAAGSSATVTGAGSQFNVTGNLAVGGSSSAAGAATTLTLSSSGLASSTSLRVWPLSTIIVSGGQLQTASTISDGQITQSAGSSSLGPVSGIGDVVVSGGALTASSLRQHALSLSGTGRTTILPSGAPAATSALAALSFAGAGTLDLNDNDLVYNYTGGSPATTVRQALFAGRSGGAWNGAGIVSSKAAADAQHRTAIGYLEASLLGLTSYAGLPVDSTTLILKYTWYGDATLDGRVNADDYALLDRGFRKYTGGAIPAGSAIWLNGDFNYDGAVSSADYLLIDRVFLQQSGILDPALLAAREAQFGPDYASTLLASIPEPSAFLLLGSLPVALDARRRRARARPS